MNLYDDTINYDYNNLREIIAINIKKYRKQAGLTQEQLAIKCSLSPEHIRRIESKKAKKYFSLDTLCIISIELKIPIGNFFIDSEEEK